MGKISIFGVAVVLFTLMSLSACKRKGTPLKKERTQQESVQYYGAADEEGQHGGSSGGATAPATAEEPIPPADPDATSPVESDLDPSAQTSEESDQDGDSEPGAEPVPETEVEPEPEAGAEVETAEDSDQKSEPESEADQEPEVETASEPELSREELLAKADELAQQNFNGVFEDITSWRDGEAYARMGIGAYRWFPNAISASAAEGVEEDFPKLIEFMIEGGYPESELPQFLGYSEDSKTINPLPIPSKVGFEMFKSTAGTGSARVDHDGTAPQVHTSFRKLQNWLHEDEVRIWQVRYELSKQQ